MLTYLVPTSLGVPPRILIHPDLYLDISRLWAFYAYVNKDLA